MAKRKGTKALTSTVNKASTKGQADFEKAFTDLFNESTRILGRLEMVIANYGDTKHPGDCLRDLAMAVLRDAVVQLDCVWEKTTRNSPKKPMEAVLSQSQSYNVKRVTVDCEENAQGVHAAAFADLYDEIRLILWRLEAFIITYTLDDIWRYGTQDFPDLSRVITRDARAQLDMLWARAKRGVESSSSCDAFVGPESVNVRYGEIEARA